MSTRPGLLRPPHECGEPSCHELVRSAYCEQHRPPAWATTTSSSSERGYGSAWQRLRKRALRRDRYRCVICGEPAVEVDHIVSLRDSGASELANLQSLCKTHHDEKTRRRRIAGAGGPARRAGASPAVGGSGS